MNIAALFGILFLFTCSKTPPSALSFSAAPIIISLSEAEVRILTACRISQLQFSVIVHNSQEALRQTNFDQPQ
jgi:hypothetical protein